jgi:hypothetical protein
VLDFLDSERERERERERGWGGIRCPEKARNPKMDPAFI